MSCLPDSCTHVTVMWCLRDAVNETTAKQWECHEDELYSIHPLCS